MFRMTLFTWSLNDKRKNLLELLADHEEYGELNKSDLLEAGLSCLLHQTREKPKEEENIDFPRFNQVEELEEFYKKPMTKGKFKELDSYVNRINICHNRKWKEDSWI